MPGASSISQQSWWIDRGWQKVGCEPVGLKSTGTPQIEPAFAIQLFLCHEEFSGPLIKSPQFMIVSGKANHRAQLPIGALLLVIALFAWGLEYKTSLYKHWRHPHASSFPPAKLLTDAERPLPSKRAATSYVATSPVRVSKTHALVARLDCKSAGSEGFSLPTLQDAPSHHCPSSRFIIRAPPIS